ncbi:aquaporin-4-like [Planoprotostelium fungivorum]|uniref:Aquaporin-4-like n=1 Tax=Planoprotostelium fungivorum TaxID=1890364 RepID=A0A2P6NHJ3_9EUKA|nr:aquaporin-4-like [Planoprotostelium fungivorum]
MEGSKKYKGESLGVIADVSTDYVKQARKIVKPRKEMNITLEKDEWGNITLCVCPQKGKGGKMESYKLEDNITKVFRKFESEGKSSVQLKTPSLVILLSRANPAASLKKMLDVIELIKTDPEEARTIELFNDGDESNEEEEEAAELCSTCLRSISDKIERKRCSLTISRSARQPHLLILPDHNNRSIGSPLRGHLSSTGAAMSLVDKLKGFIPKPFDKEDDVWAALWRGALSEFFATMIFVFVGCGSVLAVNVPTLGGREISSAAEIAIALAHGFTIMVLVYSVGEVSGGHINPAVTWACMITRKISILRFVVYWIAQLLGSIAGAAAVWGITPGELNSGSIGFHEVNSSLPVSRGLLAEVYFTFVFLFVVFATAISPFAGKMAPMSGSGATGPGKLTPFAVGMTILVLHLVGIPITGASMNPARSFGPAVVAGHWDHHWVYWLGPLCGSTMAAIVAEILFLSRPDILFRVTTGEQPATTAKIGSQDYAIMKEEDGLR